MIQLNQEPSRLYPAENRVDELKRDFKAMETIFLGKPRMLEEVSKVSKGAEKKLNG